MTIHIPTGSPSPQEFQRSAAVQLNAFFQRLANLPDYANDAAAAAGNLKVGYPYVTPDGQLRRRVA